jgi:predicted transcriptional regulator
MVQAPAPAFTAREIGDEFDKTRQWAHQQLQNLEDEGLLESKNPGGNSRFYWVTKAGNEFLSGTRQD